MSALALFSVVVAVAIFHINDTNGMKDSDIQNVLGQLNKNLLQRTPLLLKKDDTGNNGDDLQELIQNIAQNPQVKIKFPSKDKEFIFNRKDQNDKRGRHRYWPWRQILYVKPAWLKTVYTPRKQNYPVNDMEHEDGKNDLSDYSKVYLVLDPDADITETDVRDLNNMISSVLTKPYNPAKFSLKDRIQKIRRYKSFVVKDNNRRRMRDSKELYAEKSSIERDYKPQRPRTDLGRGRGSRTAIPYIRHRGDIFEKE